LSTLATPVLDTLFPPVCAGCGRRGHWVCADCSATLAPIDEPACPHCGAARRDRCVCAELPEAVVGIRSAMPFDGWVQTAIHSLKYEGERARARHLGNLLVPLLDGASDVDAIVPVPLHPHRLRRLGFNQAALLGGRLKETLDVAALVEIGRRGSITPQVGLGIEERRANVEDAFFVPDATRFAGRAVVLVDDVITTTATIAACARVIADAGAMSILCLSVARAM